MEKMFDQMMKECFGGTKGPDNMKGCFEKMATFCPCGGMAEMSEADMMEKMKPFCSGMMGMMSPAGSGAGPSRS